MPAPARLVDDVAHIRECGFDAAIIEEHPRFFILVADLQLPSFYVPDSTDLMIMADYQYPMSALDMFWTNPHVRRADNDALPQNANSFGDFIGRNWQRWSWHYQGWDPAHHSVGTHLEVFFNRLAQAA